MLNKVQLIGYLGANPKILMTQDGKKIANFSVATKESWKDKATGERKERTEWHRVVLFSGAEFAERYLRKGNLVYIEGRLQTRSYENNSGQEVFITEVVVTIGGCIKSLTKQSTDAAPKDAGGWEDAPDADLDDDIPF